MNILKFNFLEEKPRKTLLPLIDERTPQRNIFEFSRDVTKIIIYKRWDASKWFLVEMRVYNSLFIMKTKFDEYNNII